jgi:endonuclease-8
MPEGDTILRTANVLRPVLQNQNIVTASSPLPALAAETLGGELVTAVESRGKHLLLHLSDRRCLHSHMGMTGSWHVYGRNEGWRKPERNARLVLTTSKHVVVCFTPKIIELLSPDRLRRHPWLSRLGPDLLSPSFDMKLAIKRLRIHNITPLGVALMNQTVLCGIGNVYKSELLFLEQRNPFAPVAACSDAQLQAVLELAVKLMHRNTGRNLRQTRYRTDGPRLWVYERAGEPCLKCGIRIRMQRQGDLGRSTYFCPTCQHVEQPSPA